VHKWFTERVNRMQKGGQEMDRKKVAFFLDEEIIKELDRIKQIKFYDKSYAELYRYLMKLGLDAAKERS